MSILHFLSSEYIRRWDGKERKKKRSIRSKSAIPRHTKSEKTQVGPARVHPFPSSRLGHPGMCQGQRLPYSAARKKEGRLLLFRGLLFFAQDVVNQHSGGGGRAVAATEEQTNDYILQYPATLLVWMYQQSRLFTACR